MLCQIEQCTKCGYCNRELDPDAYRVEARISELSSTLGLDTKVPCFYDKITARFYLLFWAVLGSFFFL